MYSSNGPPSFSSAGINTGDQDLSTTFHFQPSTGDISGQLPSYGAFGHGQGNSNNELLPETNIYRRRDQTAGNVNRDDEAPTSFSALGHGQGNSHNNHDGTNYFNHSVGYAEGYSDGGGAPSVGKVRHLGHSLPSGAGVGGAGAGVGGAGAGVGGAGAGVGGAGASAGDLYSGGKMPSMGDVGRREKSQNGVPLLTIDDQEVSGDALMGISLVGEKFKKYYPMAYYQEKLKDDVYK